MPGPPRAPGLLPSHHHAKKESCAGHQADGLPGPGVDVLLGAVYGLAHQVAGVVGSVSQAAPRGVQLFGQARLERLKIGRRGIAERGFQIVDPGLGMPCSPVRAAVVRAVFRKSEGRGCW